MSDPPAAFGSRLFDPRWKYLRVALFGLVAWHLPRVPLALLERLSQWEPLSEWLFYVLAALLIALTLVALIALARLLRIAAVATSLKILGFGLSALGLLGAAGLAHALIVGGSVRSVSAGAGLALVISFTVGCLPVGLGLLGYTYLRRSERA